MVKRWTTMLVAAAAVSLLGACGSADSPAGGGPSTSKQAGKSFESLEQFQLALSACLREHGVNVPDPSADGGFRLDGSLDMAAFETAAKACREQLGTPPAQEGKGVGKSDEELLADQLKIARCLREHGLDVPDPTATKPLDVPRDAPEDVLTKCAPNGVVGRTGGR
ncbi:hypothetical protein [Lentzea sp. NPDC059081]|uniref:hypothetical protein n=1 Tax=Lentzea sp. NPDC059081 TaxID=3346719 RepID=UPI00369E6C93